MDAIAARLGIDRIDVRRRNLIAKEEMPYRRPLATLGTDIVLDSGDYAGLLDKALAAIKWDALQDEPPAPARRRRMRRGGPRRCSSRRAGSARSTACGCPSVRRRPRRGGDRRGIGRPGRRDRGGADLRRRARRRLSRACASCTAAPTASRSGMGAFASRVTVMTGEATRLAAVEVRAQGDRDRGRAAAAACGRARHRSTAW